MLLDDAARKIVLEKWGKPEGYFEIPGSLINRFGCLRTYPVRAAKAAANEPVYLDANSHGSIVGAYPDALLVGSPFGRATTTYWVWFAIALCGFSFLLFLWMLTFVMSRAVSYPSVLAVINCTIVITALIIIVLTGIWCRNLLLQSPPDWPIMFNRKTKEVAYFPVRLPRFFKFWCPTKPVVSVRSWNDAHFRIYKTTQFTGVGFKQVFELALLWGDENNPSMLKELVFVGDNFTWGDEPCLQIWEHIRRYMEGTGNIINEGESLRKPRNANSPLRFPPHIEQAAGGAQMTPDQIAAKGIE